MAARTAFAALPSRRPAAPIPGAFHRRVAPRTPLSREVCLVWEPATGLAALPRTIRLPALFHSPLRSRAEELDPHRDPRALRSWARRAARRPSTSAIVALREHDHGRPNPAVPHPRSPAGAASLSTDRLAASPSCGWPPNLAVLKPAEESRARGHDPRQLGLDVRHLPPRSLAVEASPQPDRLGHLMSRARGDRRLETPTPPDPPSWTLFELAWRATLARRRLRRPTAVGSSDRAASRALPRRRSRSAAPEVPSIVGFIPVRGFASASTSCPQPVDS